MFLITLQNSIHEFVKVALPIIVPAHVCIDVIDAHDKNITKVYVESNIKAFATYPLVSSVFPGLGFLYFMTFSAIHFRHQMLMFDDDDFNERVLASSLLVSMSVLNPDIVYLFLMFIHTPSQYMDHFELLKKHKHMSILYISSMTTFACCCNFQNWFENDLIGTFIIAHIFYQEFDRFKRQDDSTF